MVTSMTWLMVGGKHDCWLHNCVSSWSLKTHLAPLPMGWRTMERLRVWRPPLQGWSQVENCPHSE
jgi:hypothetical protein